jgi:CubicO group peptidase (beta-lactamase class C family)
VYTIPRLPRPPLIPDPLHRIRVPRDLDSVTDVGEEADPREAAMSVDGVERIWEAVRSLYSSGVHPAISLCVRRHGRIVLNRAIGHAKGNGPHAGRDDPRELVSVDTPFVIFSASKALTAMLVHLLDQRRELHIQDRVCDYIPEFARHGKDAITIAHVLSHRAGVPTIPPEALDLRYVHDDQLIVEMMCDAKPSGRAGSTLGYHAISGGFILAEIVRRVTGQGIRDFLRTELLEPLAFRYGNYGVEPSDVGLVGESHVTGASPLPPLSNALERALGVSVRRIGEIMNDERFLTATVPSGNAVMTAEELSRFFELLRCGGELGGVRIFEPRTIRRAATEQSYHQLDTMLGFPARFSLGFILGARLLSIYGPDTDLAFGHLGFTNIIGWADPERGLSGGLITSGKPVVYPELPMMWGLMRRIGIEAGKP